MSVVVYCKVTNWGKWFSRSISGSNTETSTMSTVILKAKAARVFTAICNPTYKPEKKLRERRRSSRFNTFFVKDGRSHVMCLSILGVDAQYVVGIQQLDTSNVREYWTVHFFRLMFLLRRIYCKANFATVYVKLTHRGYWGLHHISVTYSFVTTSLFVVYVILFQNCNYAGTIIWLNCLNSTALRG